MSKKINIKFELNYDLNDLRFMVGEDFPEEQFRERVIEYAFHDLHDMLRSDSVDAWADVEEVNE
jgi:hypothetical protein